MITVVYSIRDRDTIRLEKSVKSLINSTDIRLKIIVVDYGSKAKKKDIEKLCDILDLCYIRTETEGLPWSRARALNIGVRKSNTKYVITTDIDMLFEGDIINECLISHQKKDVFYCKPMMIPKDGEKSKAIIGNKWHLGGYQFIERSVFDELYGFDERIEFWGMEDVEWNVRLTHNGYKTRWINKNNIRIYHTWHPNSDSEVANNLRPIQATYNSQLYVFENQYKGYINLNWGEILKIEDRPILAAIKNIEPFVFNGEYRFEIYRDFYIATQKNKFIRIDLGNRFMGWSGTQKILYQCRITFLMLRKLLRVLGFELTLLKNYNFDFFYAILRITKEYGLIDYYITDDFCSIYLLFR